MQRKIFTSLASGLAMALIGASCAPQTSGEPTANGEADGVRAADGRVGTTASALTSSALATYWHADYSTGCVCTGRSGGGYTSVISGEAADVQTFSDPLPVGARVTDITVTSYGTSCSNPGSPTVAVSIDGIALSTFTGGGTCDCGACDVQTASVTNAAGIPGFVAGGSHTFSIGASGGNYFPSEIDIVFTYDFGATTTTLSSTTNPSLAGQSVTFTAHVVIGAGSSGSIAGINVAFKEGATTLGTSTTNAAGDATLTTSALSVGTHPLQANFAGGNSYGASTSGTLSQIVKQAQTTTTLASSINPSIVNGSTTLTANVAAVGPGAGTASGNVTFKDGNTVLGTVALSGGKATLDVASLAVGDHALTAEYGGSTSFLASTSSTVTQSVKQDGTTTAIVADINPSTYGAAVTFKATVGSSATGGTPTGQVTFTEGATVLATSTLDGAGETTFATALLAGGSHTITATYGGDANHEAGSTGNIAQVVNGAATTAVLGSSGSPTRFGEPITLTATVTSPIAGAIDGTVTFQEGVTVLGTSSVSNGVATLTTSALSTASHDIFVNYNGVPNYAASTSSSLTQAVVASDTTTTLIASSNPAAVGSSVTFTATVLPVAPGAGSPSGTVTFKDGSTVLGTGSIASGQATFTTSSLPVGSHSITAEYGATTDFNASATSSSFSESIVSQAATTALTSAPNPSMVKSAVLLTATITADGGVPSGEVTFVDTLAGADGGTSLGTSGLDAGVATLSVSTLDVGNHTLSAQYGGDSTYGSATASTAHVVTKVPSATALASTPNPSAPGETVTLTATVTSDLAGATGAVDFLEGTTKLGSANLSGSGSAAITVPTFTVGGHVVSAVYAGDALHATSTSTTLTQNVGQDPGANTTTDGGTTDAGSKDAGAFDAAAPVDSGCGCSTVPTGSSLAVIPSLALVAALGLRRRVRKQDDATKS